MRRLCEECARGGQERELGYAGAARVDEGEVLCVARRCVACGTVVLEAFAPSSRLQPPVGACLGCGREGAAVGSSGGARPEREGPGGESPACGACGLDAATLRAHVGQPPEAGQAALAAASWVERARELLDAGEVRGTLLALDLALLADPSHAEAWEAKASVLRRVGFPERALPCLEQALAQGADRRAALVERALALVQLGRRAEGVAVLDEAVALDPAYLSAHVHRGIALRKLGRHEEAVAAFRRGLELEPGDTSCWYNLAATFLEDNRPEEAGRAVREALRLDPRLLPAHSLAGDLGLYGGDPEAAVSHYDQALALLSPGSFDALLLLRRATALDRLGRLPEAASSLREILRSCPGDRTAMSALSRVEARMAEGPATCEACAPEDDRP
ncbi:MAG: tetratricopeptide repeat protein [Planctomycetes bacterium]|nr:tetratricopeptide repeat protein [Planctomycetota bacterium]